MYTFTHLPKFLSKKQRENVKYFICFGILITNDARCVRKKLNQGLAWGERY